MIFPWLKLNKMERLFLLQQMKELI